MSYNRRILYGSLIGSGVVSFRDSHRWEFRINRATLSHKLRNSLFDLYLLDNRLPDMNGLDLIKEIRAFDARTPIVLASADARARLWRPGIRYQAVGARFPGSYGPEFDTNRNFGQLRHGLPKLPQSCNRLKITATGRAVLSSGTTRANRGAGGIPHGWWQVCRFSSTLSGNSRGFQPISKKKKLDEGRVYGRIRSPHQAIRTGLLVLSSGGSPFQGSNYNCGPDNDGS